MCHAGGARDEGHSREAAIKLTCKKRIVKLSSRTRRYLSMATGSHRGEHRDEGEDRCVEGAVKYSSVT